MQDLRANTQVIVSIGPFSDVDDGFVPETGVTLGAADEAELLKHGSTSVVSLAAATWAAVTSCDGYYSLTLTASHTDTEGMLLVVVQDDSVCLPVKQEFMVLSEAAWDSLYAAKDTGYMDVQLADAAHGGSSATIAAKGITVTATDADTDAVTLTGLGTGNGLNLAAGVSANAAGMKATGYYGIYSRGTDAAGIAGVGLSNNTPGVVALAHGTGADISYGATELMVAIQSELGTNGVGLVDNAITAAKHDETTAFPLASADTVARTGSVIESNGSITLQQAMSVILAAVAGVSVNDGTDFKDPSGTNTRVNSTVSGKNRTAITLTPSS